MPQTLRLLPWAIGLFLLLGCARFAPQAPGAASSSITPSAAQVEATPTVVKATATVANKKRDLIYDPDADPKSEIKAALAKANDEGKYVLLDFGADWCPDCVVLAQIFEDKDVKALLDANYVVVRVDVGKWDHNLDVAESYGNPIKQGIPAVVILGNAGEVVTDTADGSLANARYATPPDILEFLQKWIPKKQ